jgi:hypothetical protein
MYVTACKYHLQSLDPLVVVRYPTQCLSLFPSIILFITSSITIRKIMGHKMHPWLTPAFIATVSDNLPSCTTSHVFTSYSFNNISYMSWYSISIHYFPHLVPIYGLETLFKIYKH